MVCAWILACSKEERGINVAGALRYQVEKESDGKLALVGFKELSSKRDHVDKPSIYALTYQATVLSKEDLRWGTSRENKLSRFIPYAAENNVGFQNREITKAGESREVTYTIVFQKKDGRWVDQFGKAY
jgi:hypothetical protein